jgi:hypothetical protein
MDVEAEGPAREGSEATSEMSASRRGIASPIPAWVRSAALRFLER